MLELRNISFETDDRENGKKTVLNNISTAFPKNGITVITGHNGSGKSTLIKIIGGILSPTGGSVLYNGADITQASITERARLGFTTAFQQPVRFKGLTVRDILNAALGKQASLALACEYLSSVGLCAKDYVSRELDGTLSGGEIKRIELATALAKGGEVLLFDEPEAGIDIWSFDNLTAIFSKLAGKTVIIVSHQRKILEIADNILLLNGSDDAVIGSREEMLPKIGADTRCAKL